MVKKFYGFKDGDTGIVYSREQEIPIGTTPKTLYAILGRFGECTGFTVMVDIVKI